jgi:formate/nitrite transporter FocA (FNT family)
MIKSIMAGFLIALGGIINLSVGGMLGAFLFAIGLMTILTFQLDLFTGKTGLLVEREIGFKGIAKVWIGNFFGTFFGAMTLIFMPSEKSAELVEKAANIVAIRNSNLPLENFILGLFCGLLMWIAVRGWKMSSSLVFAIAPVAAFILAGFNHCVADMFYIHCVSMSSLTDYLSLIPTTLGNVIGGCLIPLTLKYS